MSDPRDAARRWTMGMTKAKLREQQRQKKLHPRERIESDVEAFLKNGGKITKVKEGATAGTYGKP